MLLPILLQLVGALAEISCDTQLNREVLTELYASTSGPMWTASSRVNWNTSSDISMWSGVTCSAGSVTQISISNSNLTGKLPVSIGLLLNLTDLELSGNGLFGTLPAEWSSLVQLTKISLFSNYLTGPLPAEWSSLVSLTTLLVYKNHLSGTLPVEWSALTGLDAFQAHENNLTGSLPPEWSALVSLTDVEVYQNQLSGSLPAQWSSLTSLTSLSLFQNNLSGTLPPEWSAFTGLTLLQLGRNSLSGSLPAEWSALSALKTVAVAHNQLSGSLPPEWAALIQVTGIDISFNNFTGWLPAEWSALTGLTILAMSHNQLSGTLPPEWSALSQLAGVDVSSNNLIGTLPPEWAALSQLSTIYLYLNAITGSLPTEWSGIGALASVAMSHNQLSGTLPPEWSALSQLANIDFGNNFNLTGSLPPEWSALGQLTTVYLPRCNLSGTLPPEWGGGLQALIDFQLNGNQFSGSLPPEWSSLTRLSKLVLADNQLSGTIPASLSSIKNLSVVNLSSNSLIGAVPSTWLMCSSLTAVDVHNNSFRNTPLGIEAADGLLRCNHSLQINLCGNVHVINRTTMHVLRAQGQWENLEPLLFPGKCLRLGEAPTSTSSLTHTSAYSISASPLEPSITTDMGSGSLTHFTSMTGSASTTAGTSTASSSCLASLGFVSNVAMFLEATRGSVASFTALSNSVPVGAFIVASACVVRIKPVLGIQFTGVSNASSSIGQVVSASVAPSTGDVVIGIVLSSAMGAISLSSSSRIEVHADIVAIGPCIEEGHRERVALQWSISPLPPPSALVVARMTTFRSSTVVAAVLGNPVTAMTATGLVSLLSLEECMFSDVDPLDTSVSPVTSAAVGPELGQYYRGAVVVALSLYCGMGLLALCGAFVLRFRTGRKGSSTASLFSSLAPHLAKLRFPSVGMVVVGLFGQGMATCGVSLIRLDITFGDVVLGIVSLIVCIGLVGFAGWATTSGLQARLVKMPRSGPTQLGWTRRFLACSTWQRDWEDINSLQYKERYMMLIDDLSRPWWTAVEMSSSVIQGSILGIRKNSLAVCRGQLWSLSFHCLLVFAAAVYFRPCGAILSNVFLVLSKLGAFLIAMLVLLHALTLDDGFASSAEVVTSVSIAIATFQTLVQILTAVLESHPTASMKRLLRLIDGSSTVARHNDRCFSNSGLLQAPHALQPQDDDGEDMCFAISVNKPPSSLEETIRRSGASGAISRRELMEHLASAMNPATCPTERLERLLKAAVLSGGAGRFQTHSFFANPSNADHR